MNSKCTSLPIVSSDYDGTIFDTFTPSPRGRGVEAGYRYGLKEIFGDSDLLDAIGGLRNRSPGEVIQAVLARDTRLAVRGHEYAKKNWRRLESLVPQGKGMQCAKPSTADVLTETLVRVRLDFLMPEITRDWPRPFEGALETLASLEAKGYKIAIISSGHTTFIKKTFECWGASCPSILVTDDDMRALGLSPARYSKPNRLSHDVMLLQAGRYVANPGSLSSFDVRVYIGDSHEKDGGLARNTGVPFAWFNPKRRASPLGFGLNEVQFQTWSALHSIAGLN